MDAKSERVNARRLIGGPSDKLMAVAPLKHAWAWEILDVMEANTWFPREIDLSRDIRDYNHALTPAERRMYDKALAFLSNLDGIQLHNITDNIARHVTSPEVRMCLVRQAWEEAVHVKSYATMIEAVALDPFDVYTTFERDEMLAKKNAYILEQSAMLETHFSPRTFALAMVANIALEGIYFFSGFLSFYVLARNGKMTGSADMIRYIQRDEQGTHLELFTRMFETMRVENPEVFDAEFWEDAKKILRSAVELEASWGRYIIEGGVLGVTDAIVDAYMQHLGNKRAALIGLGELYPGVKNPVEWVDKFSAIKGVETNFFEGKVTSYAVGGTLAW